jgi:hypothetical protein
MRWRPRTPDSAPPAGRADRAQHIRVARDVEAAAADAGRGVDGNRGRRRGCGEHGTSGKGCGRVALIPGAERSHSFGRGWPGGAGEGASAPETPPDDDERQEDERYAGERPGPRKLWTRVPSPRRWRPEMRAPLGYLRPRLGRSGHSKYMSVDMKSSTSSSSTLDAPTYLFGSTWSRRTFACQRPPL